MANLLFNIIIYPLIQLFDLCYLFVFRIFDNPGIALIGVSLAVSVFTLPLYFEAEKWQELERNIQKRLAKKIAKIKAVFTGDERYLILSTFYRQNNYHPLYALRSSTSLLLQIPFFMAAFSYLSHLDTLLGASFLFIDNLGMPDGFLEIHMGGVWTVNILPLVMTLINICAAAVYTKNFLIKEKIQLFGMALVFLILLYNSPAGLVLYWTCNNIFSLIKNCLQKTKYAHIVVYGTTCIGAVLLAFFVLFFHHGVFYKRFIVALLGLSVFVLPIFINYVQISARKFFSYINRYDNAIVHSRTMVFSALSLFFLAGIFISSSLIVSSVEEFSFIEHYTSPLPFIVNTTEQAFGFFIFWVFCIYLLLPYSAKYILTIVLTLIAAYGLLNTFVFSGDYGFLTIEMQFSEKGKLFPTIGPMMVNIFALIILSGLIFFLLCYRRKQILQFCQVITLLALFAAGIVNIFTIHREFLSLSIQKQLNEKSRNTLFGSSSPYSSDQNGYAPVYEFSKNGKNVLIIMLDRGLPGFVPYIFNEKPELYTAFSGFSFFPNTISFGAHTLYGAPAVFGGYEYAPLVINARSDETLASKYNEAFLVLPRIFSDNNYKVTITDPPLYESTIQDVFDSYPDIKAGKIMSTYAKDWLARHPNVQLASISAALTNRLIYFSFLKCAPFVFRHYIYDDGHWLTSQNGNTPLKTIESYSMLDVLPEITSFTDAPYNTFTMIVNDLTHEPAFLQAPDYTIPSITSTNKGRSLFALDYHYHVNAAALLLLGKWFTFLKENGVYDNTRIIIVSDHGINAYANYDGNIILPTGECLEFYAALLMFKDFDAEGVLLTDNHFMVNADTPILATQKIIVNPVNTFSGNPLKTDKEQGVTITTSQRFSKPQPKYQYDIAPHEWLHVHDSIFILQNWKPVKK